MSAKRSRHQPATRERTRSVRAPCLLLEVDVCADIDDLPDSPSQSHAQRPAQQAHDTRLGEEQLLDVAVTRADRLHDPDFTPPLENRHHQRVHNTDRGDGQSKAAEDAEEHVDDREELRRLRVASSIEKVLNPIFLIPSSTA